MEAALKTAEPHWAHLVVAQLLERVAILLEAPGPVTVWLLGILRLWREQLVRDRVEHEASFF